MRIRRNVKYLSSSEKTAFVDAVLALKTIPSVLHPGDPASNRYDDYAEVHMNAMMATVGWAHRRPAFFPWHRVMLLAFENDLAAINSSVTLPYWDWPDVNSDPFTNDFLGGDGDAGKARVALGVHRDSYAENQARIVRPRSGRGCRAGSRWSARRA